MPNFDYLIFILVPLRSYQKNNFNEYKKMLSGKIEYKGPSKDPDNFMGYLKLKTDPKVEQLSLENFLPRGAKLVIAEWSTIFII